MMNIPWYKKFLGYIYPIVLAKHKNDKHPKLKINYYQGQIQLESEDALYSDGYRYSPFRISFNFLNKKNKLEHTQRFLLLGAGLGSALHRLQKIHNLYPDSVLVEYDSDIMNLSKQYLLTDQQSNVKFILQDALDYLKACNQTFDLIGIDLFDKLENSFLLTQNRFWQEIKKVSHYKSNIIVNTIFINKKEKESFEIKISQDFVFERINRKPNYFYILYLK